jgi:hypothetical protein
MAVSGEKLGGDQRIGQPACYVLGIPAGGMAPKAPSITSCINLHLNQRDASLKTSVDGPILVSATKAPPTLLNVMSFAFTNSWTNPCFSADATSDITKHDELHIH